MTNNVQQQAGYTYNSQVSGLTVVVGQTGSSATHTNTTVDTLSFNPQTTGPAAGAMRKGSLMILSAGGHAPDIVATVASSTSVTILTATSSSASPTCQIFNYPALISGEASALTTGQAVTSSYYVGNSGTGGVVNQTDCVNSVWGYVMFIAGGAFTPAAGGYLSGWFTGTSDTGTSFEKVVANTALPRSADFTIPLWNAAYAAGDIAMGIDIVRIPSMPFKTVCFNGAAVTMPSTWGIWLLPIGTQMQN